MLNRAISTLAFTRSQMFMWTGVGCGVLGVMFMVFAAASWPDARVDSASTSGVPDGAVVDGHADAKAQPRPASESDVVSRSDGRVLALVAQASRTSGVLLKESSTEERGGNDGGDRLVRVVATGSYKSLKQFLALLNADDGVLVRAFSVTRGNDSVRLTAQVELWVPSGIVR